MNSWRNRLVIATLCCQTVHDLLMTVAEKTDRVLIPQRDEAGMDSWTALAGMRDKPEGGATVVTKRRIRSVTVAVSGC